MAHNKNHKEDPFGSPPGAPADEEGDKPVGVDKGYSASRPGVKSAGDRNADGSQKSNRYGFTSITPQQQVPARYFNKELDTPGGWGQNTIARLQSDLVSAGLLKRTGFSLGVYDSKTRSAYEQVLSLANRSGKTASEALDEFLQAPFIDDDAKEKPRIFRPVVDSPEDLKKALNEQLPEIMGRSVSDGELNQMVSAYQNLQVQAQRREFDTAETGGTIAQAMSPETFAEQEAQRIAPNEVYAKKLANQANVFAGMFNQASSDAGQVAQF